MATRKRGLLTVSGEWARHLRPFWRRLFWRGERRAARQEARRQATETLTLKEIKE
jgi:hypothetical protein